MNNLWAITLALCSYESGNSALAINYTDPTPALGFCQVRMIAARDVGFKGTQRELLDKNTNLAIAHRYLKKQLRRCGSVLQAVKAYNMYKCGDPHTDNTYSTRVKASYRRLYGKGFR